MQTDRKRTFGFACLFALGVILLAYGGWLHAIDVLVPKEAEKPGISPEQGLPKPPESVAKSEWAVVKDVTFGGLSWDRHGLIKQTYTGEAPAAACPT
jgi:hypothetical protein